MGSQEFCKLTKHGKTKKRVNKKRGQREGREERAHLESSAPFRSNSVNRSITFSANRSISVSQPLSCLFQCIFGLEMLFSVTFVDFRR